MVKNNSSPDNVLTMPQRGPLMVAIEERRRRNADPDSWPANNIQSRSPLKATTTAKVPNLVLKTRGEIEAEICVGIRQFELEYLGRGPKVARGHLIGDLFVVRLFGALTLAEQQLIKSPDVEKGRDLVKQVRTQLVEAARPVLEAMVVKVTGVRLISLHHDLSTATGEECFLFTLAAAPVFRDVLRKGNWVERE